MLTSVLVDQIGPDSRVGVVSCACAQKVVPCTTASNAVVFENLSESQKYFSMVVRDKSHSFYGVPPEPTRPGARRAAYSHRPARVHNDRSENSVPIVKLEEDNNQNNDNGDNGNADLGDSASIGGAIAADDQFWKTWNAEVFPKAFSMLTSYENYTVSNIS